MGSLHKHCHGHACTVVVVKGKETYEIIGDYNPLTRDNTCKCRVENTQRAILIVCKNEQNNCGFQFLFV
ncbi:hypothetical protein Glove_428g35 [Diversispora epigaea]|uniref:Uncharacterized protein n=1 Tax=Diversispora epigaea TaxID=1348612 RepID=A0A397GZ11_9GLOM|nr:hypothetical protein Glove_428g35 [Diversispora epigaea]